MKAKKFEDLAVWGKAHQLVLNVYQLTKDFPPEERLDWFPRCGGLLCPFQQILQKGLINRLYETNRTFIILLKVLLRNYDITLF